jgi:signal transduction histidine kinase
VFFDSRHRRLYLGTLTNGLFILDFHSFETLTVGSNEREANIFYAHVARSDSTVITPSLIVLGKSSIGQGIAYRTPRPVEEPSMNTRTLVRARSGDLWFVRNSTLYQFDSVGKRLKRKWDAGGEISHLYEDLEGRIWLGTRFVGLKYVDPNENGAPLHTFTSKITGITYIINDSKSTLWIATGTGLFKVNLNRNTFRRIPGTERFWIKNLLKTKHGELWFVSYDNALYLLQNDKLIRFPLDRNQYLARAHCLVLDRNGFFWVPTNNGLFRISRQDLLDFQIHRDSTRIYYHLYTRKDGFRMDEFNGGCEPCAVRLRNGYVSLPSIDGMVFFKPEQVPLDIPESKIFINRIEASFGEIPVNSSILELRDVSDLKVFVSSPYLGDRQNQQLFYTVSVEGRNALQQNWYRIENEQQSIHLNNLESGTYTLKIRKNGGFGRHSKRLTTLTIIIPYAWYETWPFKAIIVVLVLLVIYLYFKNRLKKADRVNRILESRVSEKTRDLQETLGVLKTSEQELLKQTRLQMHLIASISHDIRSPLRSIEFTSGKLAGLIQNGDYTLAETVGTSVNDSSRRILTLLENMLSYVRSQFSDSSVVYETFAARGLVDEVSFIFKQAFVVQENQFENNVPETLQIRSNRQLLKIILHNLIDNANKFTSEGAVTVSASLDREVITLTVSDTGAGLPEKILGWFNESDAAYPESPDGEPGIHGIGLIIVKELTEILKVKIKAGTTSGTQFSIALSQMD